MFNFGCSLQPSTGLFIALYRVSAVFVLFLPFWVRGILSNWKLNTGEFQDSLDFPPDSILYVSPFFFIFIHIFIFFAMYLNPHASTLAKRIFIEAGPQQV